MDIRRQHPFGILGPVQYDFLPLNGATATEFAAEAAFASSPAQKRAETSSAWSQRFVAATNMTLLFYWSSPGDSTPRGVFPLFHETTVEYMRSFEGKDHVVIVRPRPSVPSCRVVYLSLPSEGQARRLAQRLMECRPEVLSLAAEMARSSATTVKREMETAQELERARDELLAAVQSALERATGAAELVLDLEHRVEAAWQAHGSLALEDGASVDGGGSRGGSSSAGKPPKLAPLQRHAGGEIHGLGEAVSAGEALRAGAALAAPSGAGTAAAGPAAAAAPGAATAAKSAAKPASGATGEQAAGATATAAERIRRGASLRRHLLDAPKAASQSPTPQRHHDDPPAVAAAPPAPPRSSSAGRRAPSQPASAAPPRRPLAPLAITPATAAAASRRVFAELEARVRSAAAATNRLRDVAERSEERFRRLARVNAMLVRQFRQFLRDWGPGGTSRTFGRATPEARRRSRRASAATASRERARSLAAAGLSSTGQASPADGAAVWLMPVPGELADSGSDAADAVAAVASRGVGAGRGEVPPPLGRRRSASVGSPSPRVAASGSAADLAGVPPIGAASPLGASPLASRAAGGGAGPAAPGDTKPSAEQAKAGRGSEVAAATGLAGSDAGGPGSDGSATKSSAFSRLMLTPEGAPVPAPAAAPAAAPTVAAGGQSAPVAGAAAGGSEALPGRSEADVEEALRHLPPPPSATDDPLPPGRERRGSASARFAPAAPAAQEPKKGIFGSIFGRGAAGRSTREAGATGAAAAGPAASGAAPTSQPSKDRPRTASVAGAALGAPAAPSALRPPPAAPSLPEEVTTSRSERFPGRVVALIMQVQQLGPSAVQPAGWAYMTASAFSRELRTPPLQAYLDPETKRSCRLDARGPRGGYVALSFVVDRALADEGSNLEIRLAAQRAFRADVTVGACAVSLWQLQQWPGKAHAVWVELQSPDAALKPKPYEIPVPVGRDPAFPQRAALGELPPPPVTGRPCVLLQLVYTLTPPGEGGKLPRVEFFDSARARREQEEARKQVEAMSRGQASRGHGAEEIVFSRGKDSPKTDGPTPAAAAAPTGAGAAASQPAAAASATPKQAAAVSADRAAADAAAAAKLEAALAAAAAAEERAASAEQRASQAEEELAVVKHKLVRLAKAVQHSRAQQKAQTAASPASHKDSP